MLAGKACVNVEDQSRFRPCFRLRLMDRMAFLPEKLRCAQEQARAHFPPDDVRPLIYENWQIAIRLHPSRVTGADDRL